MIVRRRLQHDDYLWALDHSRRRYRVRPTRLGDLTLRFGETYPNLITVVSMDGKHLVVMAAKCKVASGRWHNTDAYADFRLLAINRKRALRNHGDSA
ncbi:MULTISPECIES: hypothetical protein [unclassified Methylobacterium]|uniref:hypothetical protein n=1 Tax=unclassified Methylobacterium TaxID=2615210 RepID=UPI0022699847|nr:MULTISPECIES: hypothetical protein [unclassified Methylobacterium]